MLRLVTLGRLELSQDGNPLLASRRKLLTVLAYLVRAGGRPTSRSQLALLFWPVEDEIRARRSVRQALTDLRRAVGDSLLERDEGVSIRAGALALDVEELEQAVAGGEPQRAVDLWEGDFLAGAEDLASEEIRSWLETERQLLRRRLGVALDQLIEAAERRGAWEAGVILARKAAGALPYDEAVQARYQRLLALAGRAEGAPAVSSPAGKGLLSPDLIARGNDFAVLTALWTQVVEGKAGVAVIEGDEGCGRTRLAEEFTRWVRLQSPRPLVVPVRAFEAEQTRPGVLLRHLLAGLAGAPGLGAAPPATLAVLAARVPEIAERFPALQPDPAGAVGEAAARALSDVAAEQPVLVVVDDADFADAESRRVLEDLCRHPSPRSLIVVTAMQGAFPQESSGRSVRLTVGALSEAQLDALLAGMADFVTEDRRALAGRLFSESAGNPLAAIELVTALADRGTIAPRPDGLWALQPGLAASEPLPVPMSIRTAAALRLRQLPRDAARVLQAAAVLGREAELVHLRAVAGLDVPRFDEALDQLIGRRFLRLAGSETVRVELSHELVRQAVYQDLPPGFRARLHARAWRALRRSASGDAARRGAVEHHRARMREAAFRRPYWIAAGLLLVLGGAAAALVTRRGRPPADPGSVIVLPFATHGGGAHAYLGEGIVTLLGAALDGLGGMATADARAGSGESFSAPSPERARAAAERAGARLFVLGDVLETNGRFELEAALYDDRGRRLATARAQAGSEAAIYAAVDELAKQLAVGRGTAPGEEIARAAAATTASLPALKSYLTGERQLLEGSFGPAVESFQTAVRTDSTFALAYYRLAIAAEWDMRSDQLSGQAARQAVRYGERLTARARTLVTGLLEWRSGNPGSAEARYQEIVTRYPQDLEAWFQLGEVRFHSGPLVGRTVGKAKEAWREVLRLEPENRFALLHLARIAGAESDSAAIRSLVPRLPELEPDGDRRLLELAAWRILMLPDEAERSRVIAAMRRTVPAGAALWQLGIYSRDPAGVDALVRGTRSEGPFEWDLLQQQLDLARGRLADARRILDRPGGGGPARVSRGFLAVLPFLPHSRPDLLAARQDLMAWQPQPDGYHPQVKWYLLGGISARLGDVEAATRYLEGLERRSDPPAADGLGPTLARGLRATVARSQGRPREALQLLESASPRATPEQLFDSPFYGGALERWHRAELLQELGRGAEALSWYESMAQLSLPELIFLAPSCLRRAEILEALHRSREAAAMYARFIELWGEADPELQPIVAKARTRLAALTR